MLMLHSLSEHPCEPSSCWLMPQVAIGSLPAVGIGCQEEVCSHASSIVLGTSKGQVLQQDLQAYKGGGCPPPPSPGTAPFLLRTFSLASLRLILDLAPVASNCSERPAAFLSCNLPRGQVKSVFRQQTQRGLGGFRKTHKLTASACRACRAFVCSIPVSTHLLTSAPRRVAPTLA